MSEQMKQDRRVKKTKVAIEQGFIELLRKKSFQDITVKNIIDKVDISRSTFYLHYLDKYDLLEQIQNEFLDNFRARLNDLGRDLIEKNNTPLESYKKYIVWMLTMFQTNSELVLLFLKIEGELSFLEKLRDLTEYNISQGLYPWLDLSNVSVPTRYVSAYVYGSEVHVLIEWLSNGCRESPEDICNYLTDLRASWSDMFPSEIS